MLRKLGQTEQEHDNIINIFKTDQKNIFLPVSKPQREPTQQDINQCAQLLEKIIAAQPELEANANQILGQVSKRNFGKGLGYYNSKNLLLLEYLIQLQFYQLFKINGEDLTQGQGLELYKRLAYLKTLITKLSPVQKKLEYQKNKLLKYSDIVKVKPESKKARKQIDENDEEIEGSQNQEVDINVGENEQDQQLQQEGEKDIQDNEDDEDALAYQPRPQALMAVKQKKQKQQANQGKYVAPKISAVLSKEDKKARRIQIQEQRRKAFLIRKFRGDLQDDQQARETGVGTDVAEKIKQKFREKTAAEEDNFVRFPESKQEKFWRKSLIRQQQKSNPLQNELKEIQTIREIFTEKQKEASTSKVLKRKAEAHKPKAGGKKVKKNQ